MKIFPTTSSDRCLTVNVCMNREPKVEPAIPGFDFVADTHTPLETIPQIQEPDSDNNSNMEVDQSDQSEDEDVGGKHGV